MKGYILAISLLFALAPRAEALDTPKGAVILTVEGKLSHSNSGDKAIFDLAMLEALPGRAVTLDTPWTKKAATYSGPLLRAILDAAGAGRGAVTIRALNDYSAIIPPEDVSGLNIILATRMDGEIMPVRDKGPMMVIYPFDEDSNLYTETYFARSVWQIKSLEVR
ncbi:molybdopterin-dependent oxidoreductase [Agrobacterium vitis]|uniref:molybdopterin-dependent oxidoreductase n=1 Tax=Agrobacterium vitis TaxID=373 RepID=UPI0018D271FE|nr:molybdopterin-dependent oxidoreductase [Agrobacterium vitis]